MNRSGIAKMPMRHAALALLIVFSCLTPAQSAENPDRSPVSLAIFDNGKRLLTANQTSGTVSLVDTSTKKVLHELPTGDKPAGIAVTADGKTVVVSHWYGYDVAVLKVDGDRLSILARIEVGPEPRGVAISKDSKSAYVAVGVADEIVRIDLPSLKISGRVTVGREPRSISITPDGKTLITTNARSKSFSVVDLASFKKTRDLNIDGDNLRQSAISPDGKYAYTVNMKDRGFATTRGNIDIGWVVGQRVTRSLISGTDETTYETVSLDPQGLAVGDVYGCAISPDGNHLAVSAAGTHEVILLRLDLSPLPWRSNGSRDLLAAELVRDKERLRRIKTDGRPLEIQFGPDGKTLYVTNYFQNSVQAIDVVSGRLTGQIDLGGPPEPDLARKGEILFHDAVRSFNQWYSCATCHADSHTNGLDFDTMNDGWHDYSTRHERSRKKVPSMRRVAKTGPWTWHGWQTSLDEAMIESFTKSMQGTEPSDDEVKEIVAYISTLDYPKNPNRAPDGSLTASAQRGKRVFESAKAACNTCHGGPEYTDGKVHDVGLDEPGTRYTGHNPPSLRGAYDKAPYLHDGRAKTLIETLKGDHSPEKVTGLGELTDDELKDLVEYVKSL